MTRVDHRTVTADEAGMRLDRWFRTHFPDLAFGRLQRLLRSGQVRLDGARVKGDARIAAGQVVRVPPIGERPAATEKARRVTPADAAFVDSLVLHRDEAVIVLDKPPGLATQGGTGVSRSVDGLLEALAEGADRPRLVHRLDKETSGVLLIARTRKAAQSLTGALKSKRARKTYWAIVKGVPSPRSGEMSSFLAPDPTRRGESQRVVRQGEPGAVHALTRYAVVDQAGTRVSWVALEPVTGRKHQLRVHMAHLGAPIIGDPRYLQIQNWSAPGGLDDRLHLHARRIVVPHPQGGMLDVTAPLPPHMQRAFELLGFDQAGADALADERLEEA